MKPLGTLHFFPQAHVLPDHEAASSKVSWLRSALARLAAGFAAWRGGAAEIAELQALDYRELRDCGLNRLDVQAISKTGFRPD